jgi:hypothetical protein
MLLNFKKAPEETSLVTIHDGYGCSIDIPSKGYVDATEYSEAMKLIINASEDNRLHTVERDIVVMLLISRFKLPLNTSPDKLLRLEDGSMIGAPMLKALYNHFVTELGADADVIKFPLGNYPNFTQSEIVNVTTVSDVQTGSKRSTKQAVEV